MSKAISFRFWLTVAVVVTVVGVAVVGPAAEQDAVDLLSGADFVPSRELLDNVLGDAAQDNLTQIALNDGADPGVRIRAIRALGLYPSEGTVETLRTAISWHAVGDGLASVYLRAAMLSLARVAGPGGVADIAPHLDHPHRDVRAAAAAALAVCDAAEAVPLLRARLNRETVLQVRLAISAAIRVLTGSSTAGAE